KRKRCLFRNKRGDDLFEARMAAERSQAAVSTLNGGRKTTAALAKSLRLAEKKTMLVQEVESARRETESWREIRRTKGCIGEVREWLAFIEGVRFAGKQLPISIRK